MKLKSLYICVFIILLIPAFGFSQQEIQDTRYEEERLLNVHSYVFNKPFAVFLALAYPGMGQIYKGEIEKGIGMWGAQSLLSVSLMMTLGDLDLNYNFTPVLNYRMKSGLTDEEVTMAVAIGITQAVLYVYNLVDIVVAPSPSETGKAAVFYNIHKKRFEITVSRKI